MGLFTAPMRAFHKFSSRKSKAREQLPPQGEKWKRFLPGLLGGCLAWSRRQRRREWWHCNESSTQSSQHVHERSTASPGGCNGDHAGLDVDRRHTVSDSTSSSDCQTEGRAHAPSVCDRMMTGRRTSVQARSHMLDTHIHNGCQTMSLCPTTCW